MYLILISVLLTGLTAEAATLTESYRAALKNMESIKRAEQNIIQSVEQKNQARAGLLPTLSGFANYTKIAPPDAAGQSPFLLTKQYSTGIRVNQPLLRGGLIGVLDLTKQNILLAQFQKEATELNLYQLVINSFYNLKIAQNDIKNLQKHLEFSKERVAEIRSRARIGRSRRGELVGTAEAQLHTSESQYQQGLIELEQIEKNYMFLTQLEPVIIPDLKEVPKVEGSLATYLSKLKAPDILASQQQVKAAESRVEIAKGGHYPSVDLVGNYYVDRTGVLATSEWDAGVVVSIPIYQGGAVTAAVKEAVAAKRISQLNAHETIRVAERELSIIFQNYIQLQAQLAATKQALEKSEEAYRLNKKDYQFGIVTNLDVLLSLNTYIQNKRSFDTLYALTHMTYNNLEAASGVLP